MRTLRPSQYLGYRCFGPSFAADHRRRSLLSLIDTSRCARRLIVALLCIVASVMALARRQHDPARDALQVRSLDRCMCDDCQHRSHPSSCFVLHSRRTSTGATIMTRCIKRMGLLRGDTVRMRYRRLDFECTRTKTDASIAISRRTDE